MPRPDQARPTAPAEELAVLREAAGPKGFFHEIGPKYRALYRGGGDVLLVHFETMAQLRARRGGLPWSTGLHRARNWSTLSILSEGRTWWRDPVLFDFFDGLTDIGFFDRADRVIFTGGGRGAYAAGAFSVAAPGAIAVLVKPYATLDRAAAPWEARFRRDWSLDFTSRYGNAAKMTDAAQAVYVVTDPTETADAMHASLFNGDHVTTLRAHHAGRDIWDRLDGLDVLDRIMVLAESGRLNSQRFAQLWRARRTDAEWRTALMRKIDRMDRPDLSVRLSGWLLDQSPHNTPARRRRTRALSRLLEIEHGAPPRRTPPVPPTRLAGE